MVMRSIGRIVALCLALTLATGVGLAAQAGAKTKKTHRAKVHETSEVTIQAVGPDGIAGHVAGRDKACRAQRHVTVYRVNSGPSVPSGEFVASTWTRGDGSWVIPAPVFPSEFFAVVDGRSAKRVTCSAAASNSLLWG
jgi:hypothetical protein